MHFITRKAKAETCNKIIIVILICFFFHHQAKCNVNKAYSPRKELANTSIYDALFRDNINDAMDEFLDDWLEMRNRTRQTLPDVSSILERTKRNHGFNGTEDTSHTNQTMEGCTKCMNHEQAKLLRIKEIKEEILEKLGLDKPPSNEQSALKLPPIQLFKDIHREFSSTDEINDYYVKYTRSYVIPRFEQTNNSNGTIDILKFTMPKNLKNFHHKKSFIWISLGRRFLNNMKNASINIYELNRHQSLEKVSTTPQVHQNLLRVEITKQIQRSLDTDLEFRLHFRVFDHFGRPVLNHMNDEQNNTFIEVHTNRLRAARNRRSTSTSQNMCDINSATRECCLYPMTVDFNASNFDWIIQPKTYEANICLGECRSLGSFTSTHGIILHTRKAEESGQCCYPRALAPIKIIYRIDDSINEATIPGMRVEKCGCS